VPVQPGRRYHALDALRAVMMLLGLVLHSAINYISTPLPVWPYSDPQTSLGFDLLVFFIHVFRMPVFFVVAGFFAALVYHRDGPRRFATNRGRRVLLPLALFWILVYPLSAAGYVFATGRAAGAVDWAVITTGAFLQRPSLLHLWFLWDLAIFYAAALAIAPLAARAPDSWRRGVDGRVGRLATSVTGAVALSVVSFLTLLPMDVPGLDTSFSLLPPMRVLVAYGVFFTFGWLLYQRRDVIDRFGARWRSRLAAGVVASVAYLFTGVARPIADPLTLHVVTVALCGLSMWLLIFGIVGAFVSLLDRPRPVVRYVSDAAYWMYLVHFPLAIWIPGLLATAPLSAFVKFAIVLVTTTAVTLTTYHLFVRSTAIGALLNGRRYPRALAHPAAVVESEHV
jgi:glucan biosynthesis protein C